MSKGTIDLNIEYLPRLPERKDFGIGCVGSGFILKTMVLVDAAYLSAQEHQAVTLSEMFSGTRTCS